MIDRHIIDSFAIKNSLSESDAIKIFCELEYFLENAVSGVEASPSMRVDNAWHHFILHTKDYSDYCRSKYAAFIHHVPLKSSIEPGKAKCQVFIEHFVQCKPEICH
ncbi:MAG: hypothetical protein JAZ17_04140 [Candidatus Thiodiazotropha endolucinida]|nr:hypothetical protein [Candidatus Thiodiazotropha endolucinida]